MRSKLHPRWSQHLALLALLSTCACPDRALQGLECDPTGRCSPGYVCVAGRCVAATADSSVLLDASAQDFGRPDTYWSEASIVDTITYDAGILDAVAQEMSQSDALPVDSGQSDSSPEDSSQLDAFPADASRLDAMLLDYSSPDNSLPDTSLPDTSPVDTGPPDTIRPDWWDTDWAIRHKLVFDNSQQAEELVDFPVLVVLDDNVVDYGRIRGQGEDLRFIDPDNGGPLAHEIEHWDNSGTSWVWVKVPSIDASSDTDFIWMYYGNPASLDAQDMTAVWSNGYVGVWHLDGDPGLGNNCAIDSSPSAQNGNCHNMRPSDQVNAKIGKGFDFDGYNDVVRIQGSSSIGHPLDIVGGPMTISAWVLPRGDGTGAIVTKRDDADCQWYFRNDYGSNDTLLHFSWNSPAQSQNNWASADPPVANAWNASAVTVGADGMPLSFYLNGTPSNTLFISGSSTLPTHYNVPVSIGARWSNVPDTWWEIDAIIDEVRIANVARSDAWMAAQYLSTSNLFVSFDELQYP